ncbi:MAG: hypothetical protein ACTS5F_00245 [Candidatus Hodgkinia cicadicola]
MISRCGTQRSLRRNKRLPPIDVARIGGTPFFRKWKVSFAWKEREGERISVEMLSTNERNGELSEDESSKSRKARRLEQINEDGNVFRRKLNVDCGGD